ncbi:MAG TPA: glycosyltransferase family 4 protein [Acidimicrobiales bacterium]|nr:glycosyltransferase family 4 protein [Acidimicrobiales bacterium]
MPVAAVVSYRLGRGDGVSVEAAKWIGALRALGYEVFTVAGDGQADVLYPGLAFDASANVAPPPPEELRATFAAADIVFAENICSLPMNPRAGRAVADALQGRRAVLRHHDVPWQRERFADWAHPLPTDGAWTHVCINALTRSQLRDRGIDAHVIYNHFDLSPRGSAAVARDALGEEGLLALQPTRAIARKNIPESIRIAERVGATFWLAGPAEEDYGPVLDALLDERRVPVIRGLPAGVTIADAYEACDLVTFPSTWEGFGNPTIESAIHRKPLVVGSYPVLEEIRAFGFRWYDIESVDLDDHKALQHNYEVAAAHFDLRDLPHRVSQILGD